MQAIGAGPGMACRDTGRVRTRRAMIWAAFSRVSDPEQEIPAVGRRHNGNGRAIGNPGTASGTSNAAMAVRRLALASARFTRRGVRIVVAAAFAGCRGPLLRSARCRHTPMSRACIEPYPDAADAGESAAVVFCRGHPCTMKRRIRETSDSHAVCRHDVQPAGSGRTCTEPSIPLGRAWEGVPKTSQQGAGRSGECTRSIEAGSSCSQSATLCAMACQPGSATSQWA